MNTKSTAHRLQRRELLGSMGLAAAGTALLNERLLAEENPAGSVADRTTSIRITNLKPHICRDRVYVRIDTNHNISGWGKSKAWFRLWQQPWSRQCSTSWTAKIRPVLSTSGRHCIAPNETSEGAH